MDVNAAHQANVMPSPNEATPNYSPRTPNDSDIERQTKARFWRSEWISGQSVVADEQLVRRQGPSRRLEDKRIKHHFEEVMSIKIRERTEEPKVHSCFLHVLMTVCYSIGLSTVLDFPYLCYKHGGVTFFIAYVVVLILVGVPLMSIEMGLGQFCSLPIASLFKALNATYVGVGKSMLFVSFWRLLWNSDNAIRSLYLSVVSVQSYKSIWSGCNLTELTNSNWCFDYLRYNHLNCSKEHPDMHACDKYIQHMKRNIDDSTFRLTPMFLDFVKTKLLSQAFQLQDLFHFAMWEVLLVLIIVWFSVFALATVGIHRLTFLLAPLKLAAFGFLVVCAVTVCRSKNSHAGLQLFLTVNVDHLSSGACWSDAVKHVLLSLSLCDGTLHKLGEGGHFHTRFCRSIFLTMTISFIVSCCSALTFFASVSHVTEAMYFQVKSGYTTPFARIHEFTGHGRILMFTAFPEFVISVKGHGWMITLYYLSIVFIALPIMIINISKLVCFYEWSNLYRFVWKIAPGKQRIKRILITYILCLVSFPCICILIHPSGQVLRDLMKHQIINAMFIIGFVESLIIAYAYDAHRFIVDINSMYQDIWTVTAILCAFCYFFATPFLLATGCIYHFSFNQRLRVIDYIVPRNLFLISMSAFLIAILPIFVYLIGRVFVMFRDNLSYRATFRPTPYWMPLLQSDAITALDGRLAFRAQPLYIKTKIDGEQNFPRCHTKNKITA